GIGRFFPEIEEVDIIVSHFPPYKTKDKSFFGAHIGDKKLRKIMEEKKPSYIICGHVHEDAGYDKFGDTIVVNCSIGKAGEYTIIDANKGKIIMVGYDA
ncbi:MAG: metallophosphoesterase, partial [Candidatus Thermoplasmatota archaeon]